MDNCLITPGSLLEYVRRNTIPTMQTTVLFCSLEYSSVLFSSWELP